MLFIDFLYFQENIVIQYHPIHLVLYIKVIIIIKSKNIDGYPQGRNDQLAMILSTIGKPTEK
jgi:hypothetical protein